MTEDQLEQECLAWFAEEGWEVGHGPDNVINDQACLIDFENIAANRFRAIKQLTTEYLLCTNMFLM